MGEFNQPAEQFNSADDGGDTKVAGLDAGRIYGEAGMLGGSQNDRIFNDAFNSFAKGDFKPFADLFTNPNFSLQQIQDKFNGVSISQDSDGIRLSINDAQHPSIQRIMKIDSNGKMTPEVRGDTQSLEYVDFQMKLPKLADGRRVDFTGWERPFIRALKR